MIRIKIIVASLLRSHSLLQEFGWALRQLDSGSNLPKILSGPCSKYSCWWLSCVCLVSARWLWWLYKYIELYLCKYIP